MAQASGSRHSMGYVAEATYGVTPATPAFKALRHSSTTLDLSKNSFQSQELRADRQIADFRMGTRMIKGNVVGELSKDSYDDMLDAALGGTWTANVLKAGLLRKSFTIERKFGDIAQYFRYTGCELDTMSLNANTGGIIDVNFGFMGQGTSQAGAIIAGATYPAPSSTSPMDALSGVLQEGGVTNAVVTSVALNLNNNLAARYVIGSVNSLEPSIGRSNVTGSLTAFFEDSTLYTKFLADTNSALSFTASDGTNSFVFLVPKLKYTGANVPVSGEGPVSVTMPFQGLYDSVTGTNLQITRAP